MLGSDIVALASFCCIFLVDGSTAGTRMLEPPSRATLWRFGYGTPSNTLDDKTDCGGYDVHYRLNGGRCGVCGDPINMKTPRKHEAGGEYSPFPRPVRASKKNGYLTVVMETTESLFGKFEFRLCRIPEPMTTPDQLCFDEHLLAILESEHGTSYQIGSRQGLHVLNLHLPASLTCQHCILQWRHVTGFMTNQDSCLTGQDGQIKCHVCQGCGEQVWYTGCTDVAILDDTQSSPIRVSTPPPTMTSPPGQRKACPCPNVDPNDNLINYSPPYNMSLSNHSLMSLTNDRFNNTVRVYNNTGSVYNNTSRVYNFSNVVEPRNITLKLFTGYLKPIPTSIDLTLLAPTLPAPLLPANIIPVSISSVANLPVPVSYASTLPKPINTTPEIPSSPPPQALRALKLHPRFRTFASAQKSMTPRTAEVLNTSDGKSRHASPITTKKLKQASQDFCYIANTERPQSLSVDFWCSVNCPGQGVKTCFFSTCKPVLCGDRFRSGRPQDFTMTSTNMRQNAAKLTLSGELGSGSPRPEVIRSHLPFLNTYSNSINHGQYFQTFGPPMVRGRGNWFNFMSLFMVSEFLDI